MRSNDRIAPAFRLRLLEAVIGNPAHQRLEQQELRRLYEGAVRHAIGQIVDAGEYPSQQRVLSFVLKENPSLTSFSLTGLAMKIVRMKLGQLSRTASQISVQAFQ